MIYYVEDDENIRNLAVYALEGKGLEVRGFATAADLYDALDTPGLSMPDAILLDIMLPGEDGITVLKHLRAEARTEAIPLMMITACGTEYDVVCGLDAGADDYLTKPFGMMELISRVKALLRRSPIQAAAGISSRDDSEEGVKGDLLALGPVVLSAGSHTVEIDGEAVSLTLKEFDLLRFLMEHAGLVFSRERLLEAVWGWDYSGNSRTVDVHIQTLRQKLGIGAAIVETVRGVGYRCKR